jgi:hypothetical protein
VKKKIHPDFLAWGSVFTKGQVLAFFDVPVISFTILEMA